MPNPYAIIAGIVFAISLFFAGVSVGYKYEAGANARALAVAQDTAIKAANLAAAAETERSVSAAKAEAASRLASNNAKHKGELDALKKSRAACARDAESMGLLNDAIDVANGVATTPAVVPVTVRPVDQALGRLGTLVEKLGVPSNGSVWPVSPPSR